jgi:hypothetical protein
LATWVRDIRALVASFKRRSLLIMAGATWFK